jgi:hypothetical protein
VTDGATDSTMDIAGGTPATASDVVIAGLPAAKLRRVTAYIESNLHRKLRLTDLGAVAHMSPYHFARLFNSATGVSPHRFVVHRRIEAADRRLEILHRLDRAGGGVQHRQSVCDHVSAHDGSHAQRLPSRPCGQHQQSRGLSVCGGRSGAFLTGSHHPGCGSTAANDADLRSPLAGDEQRA